MVYGREYPHSFIGMFGARETFGMLGVRQQAQQAAYPFYSPFFIHSDYSSLSRNEIRRNGVLANVTRNSCASIIQNFTNSYMISAGMLTEKGEDESNEQATSVFISQCACIGLSSAIASAVSHPLAVVGTWQMVQDIPVDSRITLSVSKTSAALRALGDASEAIKTSKKTFYDGLLATVSYSVLFEITKFGISKQLNQLCGVQGITKQIEQVDSRVRKEGNSHSRIPHLKRGIVLRWRRLALTGYLNYVASVASRMLWYPLETIALRMQAQGSSFRFPEFFSSAGDVVAEQGVVSLYSGAPTLGVSFVAETVFAAVTYALVVFALELMPVPMHEQIGQVLIVMETGQF